MARQRPGYALLLSAFFLTSPLAHAAADSRVDRVLLDSQRSQATFAVKVMWLLPVHGRFGKVHGRVDVDRFRSVATVDARIDAGAVEMGNQSYEDWVKSPEFFDVARHPEIGFVSEPFPLQRLHKGGQLSGTLTIRGVARPETFDLAPAECDKPAYDCPIVVKGSIRRSDFGMHSRRGTLSDKVDLHFEVYAIEAAERIDS
jgi:polyisoprenoid-binding protein YceI